MKMYPKVKYSPLSCIKFYCLTQMYAIGALSGILTRPACKQRNCISYQKLNTEFAWN